MEFFFELISSQPSQSWTFCYELWGVFEVDWDGQPLWKELEVNEFKRWCYYYFMLRLRSTLWPPWVRPSTRASQSGYRLRVQYSNEIREQRASKLSVNTYSRPVIGCNQLKATTGCWIPSAHKSLVPVTTPYQTLLPRWLVMLHGNLILVLLTLTHFC